MKLLLYMLIKLVIIEFNFKQSLDNFIVYFAIFLSALEFSCSKGVLVFCSKNTDIQVDVKDYSCWRIFEESLAAIISDELPTMYYRDEQPFFTTGQLQI